MSLDITGCVVGKENTLLQPKIENVTISRVRELRIYNHLNRIFVARVYTGVTKLK